MTSSETSSNGTRLRDASGRFGPAEDTLLDRETVHEILGSRNGKKINPAEGANYKVGLQGVMRKHVSDLVANTIVSMFPEESFVAVTVVRPRMGSLPMSLMEDPKVKAVVMIESDKEVNDILKRNIGEYGYDKNKYVIMDKDVENYEPLFQRLRFDSKGNLSSTGKIKPQKVLFLNPEWKKSFSKSQKLYGQEGFEIYGRKLENVIEANKNTVIFCRLPPGSEFNTVEGFTKGYYDMGLFWLYYFVPDDMIGKVKFSRKEETGPSPPPPKERIRRQVRESQWEKLGKDEKKWKEGLSSFIGGILEKTNLPKDKIDKLLGEEGMEYWTSVFTHWTVSLNEKMNYESLETLGDPIMTTGLFYYYYKRYPLINPTTLTEIKKMVLSTENQAEIAIKLGFDNWLRSTLHNTRPIMEDVLEAFFGAMYASGDEILNRAGNFMCVNFMAWILEQFDIDPEKVRRDSFSELTEIFNKLRWGKPEETETVLKNDIVFTLYLTPLAINNILNWTGFQAVRKLGSARAFTTKEARPKAAAAALEQLESYGITLEFALQKSTDSMMEDPAFASLYKAVKEKIATRGFVKFRFKNVSKKSQRFMILIGIRSDGEEEVIHQFDDLRKDRNVPELRMAAMEEFLEEDF